MLKYINGNYIVSIDELSGKKIYRSIRRENYLISQFPDSIDLKITNKCYVGCKYCHESSNPTGKLFNFNNTIKVLDSLPKVGIEIAIGGGDVLTCEDSFINLCSWLNSNSFLPRVTLNFKSIENYSIKNNIFEFLDKSDCKGIGISIDHYDDEVHKTFYEKCLIGLKGTVVFHIIAGIFPLEELGRLLQLGAPILILGYKRFGRAKDLECTYKLDDWELGLKRILYEIREKRKSKINSIGFDNLALDQLNIRSCLTTEEWNSLYMGEEFTHSMYVDAVDELFAPTSRSNDRSNWLEYNYNILEYFNKNRKIDYGD